jgi:hypothetical protein
MLGFGLTMLIYYLLGVVISGWLWPLSWVEHVSAFGRENFVANGHNMTSFVALLSYLGRKWDMGWLQYGFLSSTACTIVMPLCIFSFIAHLITKHRSSPSEISRAMIFLAALIPLFSPQTLFYDLGIGLMTFWALCFSNRYTWALLLALSNLFAHYLRNTPTDANDFAFPWFFIPSLLLALAAYQLFRKGNLSEVRAV